MQFDRLYKPFVFSLRVVFHPLILIERPFSLTVGCHRHSANVCYEKDEFEVFEKGKKGMLHHSSGIIFINLRIPHF